MWNPRKRTMQFRSDIKEVHRWYRYRPCGICWAVYLNVTYRQGDSFPPKISTHGTKVGEYLTREEARREVYRLNGWTYKEREA